ncbi:MAG: TMEM175 family protein [Spirulina sp.]
MFGDRDDFLLPLHRLELLCDLIFATAMTIMVLTLDFPETGDLNQKALLRFLRAQLPSLGIYLTSFVLIAFYWISHLEQFKYYRKTNPIHIWLQLLSLMFIILIPYANDFLSYYPEGYLIQVVYSLVVFFAGIFSCLNWLYATRDRQLVSEEISEEEIAQITRQSLIEPLVMLVAIAVGWIHPDAWYIASASIVVIYPLQERFFTKKTTF